MKNTVLLLLLFLTWAHVFSQNKQEKPPITAYKIISEDRDTTFVDTTLNIYKKYRFNYLRRDNFGLLPFSNVGQTYNSLVYSFDDTPMKPKFVAQSHHYAYRDASEINYYNVPTPLTDCILKQLIHKDNRWMLFLR